MSIEPEPEPDEHLNQPKKFFATSEEKVDALLTPWSLVHFLSGAAAKGIGWGFWLNFGFHAAYEVKDHFNLENVYNSKLNSVGDQACSIAGWMSVKKNDIKWLYIWLAAYCVAYGMGDNIG